MPSIAPDDPASLNSTGADVPMCAFATLQIYTSLTGTTGERGRSRYSDSFAYQHPEKLCSHVGDPDQAGTHRPLASQ